MKLSLIILCRNEENIVEQNLQKIANYLAELKNIDDYEILVCDKSEDSTPTVVKKLASQNNKIRYCEVKQRGIGAGIKHGIDESQYDFVMMYPIDMAWKIDVIERSVIELLNGSDIVYGSRYVNEAKVNRPLKRRIFSLGYRIFTKVLFNLEVKDLNGTIALRRKSIMKFRKKLVDDKGFLPTEIAIYGKRNQLKLTEIPSEVEDLRNTSNKFIFQAASNMFRGAIRKRIKLFSEKE